MSITWNGVSSDTIGVIVERIPNRYVPTRRFSPQQVAGRNGNILLVDKSFPNVEQEYEVYLSAEAQGLPSVARACAEWLMGPDGYCRLEDSYDTTVYREAFLMGGYDLENILNKFGRCTITFSCKPQKYLLTGDTPIEIPDGATTTYTGDVVQFDVITGASITSLSTTLSPIQDLHGYSNPWPAGGGVNVLDDNIKWTAGTYHGLQLSTQNGYEYTLTGTATEGGTIITNIIAREDAVILPPGTYIGNAGTYQLMDAAGNFLKNQYGGTPFTRNESFYVGMVYIEIVSGRTYNITKFIGLAKGSTALTAYSPYSNICPISGRTGLNVYRTGINIWDEEWERGTIGLTTGAKVDDDTKIRSKNYVPISPNTAYYYKFPGNWRMIYFDADKNVVERGNTYSPNIILTSPATAHYLLFALDATTEYDNNIAINYPATDHDYHVYNGSTYSVDWTSEAGTVYHGTVDPVAGQLMVDKSVYRFTGSESWTLSGTSFFYTFITEGLTSANGYFDTENGVNIYYYSSSGQVIVYLNRNTFLSTLSDMHDYFPSGIGFLYTLATPITYQLTAQEVEALVGTNNVWSSSGDVSVTVTTLLGGIVTNPTPFEARPLLTVSGVGEITVNGKSIQILESVSDFEIDCEAMEAEDNSKIYCMDFPELSGGENKIVGYGSITALTVTPRWWTL